MNRPLALTIILSCHAAVYSADWPAWRGPAGQGHSAEKNLPLKWSKTENVKWQVPLAEPGNSSPIVWGDKIFLTQANKGGSVRSLLCFAKADGKLLWQKDTAYAEEEKCYDPAYYCSASPVTDGERVVVGYGQAGMYCYGFDGKELWKRTDLGVWSHGFGNASSPVLYQDLAILWCGPNAGFKDRNWLLAVDRKTGKTIWETDQKGGSWSTPLITKVNGQDQLILCVPHKFKGFDPKTGKELWFCDGVTEQTRASALYANGIAVALCSRGGSAMAVKLGGSGDITADRLWHHPSKSQRTGSGVIVGDHVYVLHEIGIPECFDLKTGDEVWKVQSRVVGSWSSMVHADGRLYVPTHHGDTFVFAASPKYELLATNRLGERTNASIAVSDGELFIRTLQTLWCISEKK